MLRLGVIGAGLKAADHARSWAGMADVSIDAIAETSEASRQRYSQTCIEVGGRTRRAYDNAGAMLAAEACGCASTITFFYTGAIVQIDAGGGWRQVWRDGVGGERETQEKRATPLQTLLAVRSGQTDNPSPVENGIRFARL